MASQYKARYTNKYYIGDIVAIDMGDIEPILVEILEVHEDHYITMEQSDDYDDLHGELYDDDDNHYLVTSGPERTSREVWK